MFSSSVLYNTLPIHLGTRCTYLKRRIIREGAYKGDEIIIINIMFLRYKQNRIYRFRNFNYQYWTKNQSSLCLIEKLNSTILSIVRFKIENIIEPYNTMICVFKIKNKIKIIFLYVVWVTLKAPAIPIHFSLKRQKRLTKIEVLLLNNRNNVWIGEKVYWYRPQFIFNIANGFH